MIADPRVELPVEDSAFRAHEQARACQDVEEEVIARTRAIEGRRLVAEGLRELPAVVNTGGSLDDILNVTLGQATRLLQSDAGAVYLVGSKPGVVFLRATLGHAPGDMLQELPTDASVAGAAVAYERAVLYELRPPLLEEYGLAAALRARLKGVETRAGFITEFESIGEERLTYDKEQELYRVAQEALNNVLKYAHATRVTARLTIDKSSAALEIADDGVGFEFIQPSQGGGFGLPGMRERVERLGGRLSVDTSPGAGTRVSVGVPR